METPEAHNIEYNSTYISMNLIDELDYFLGGYGKPNVEFIFSLNTFVESFIACSGFYTSLNELNHINLTSPAIFPNGRPMLKMIVRETGLRFVNGVIDKPARSIYTDFNISSTRKEAQQKFISSLDKNELDHYFIQSNIAVSRDNIPLLTSKFENGEFSVFELLGTSQELVSNLLSVSRHNNIQTTLPIYLFNQQINELTKTPYSITALDTVAKLYDEKIDGLKKSLGYRYLPIPPFTNILLSQLRSVSEIPDKLVQLRADYQELRSQFVQLEVNIHEADNMKTQSDAYDKFLEFWTVFNKKYVGKNSRIFYGALDLGAGGDFDQAANRFIEKGNVSDGLSDLNWGKIAGNVAKSAYNWYGDKKVIKRFKGLTNIWELFDNSTGISQQLQHFERLFGVKYSIGEVNAVHDFIKTQFMDIRKG